MLHKTKWCITIKLLFNIYICYIQYSMIQLNQLLIWDNTIWIKTQMIYWKSWYNTTWYACEHLKLVSIASFSFLSSIYTQGMMQNTEATRETAPPASLCFVLPHCSCTSSTQLSSSRHIGTLQHQPSKTPHTQWMAPLRVFWQIILF